LMNFLLIPRSLKSPILRSAMCCSILTL
jgi:hypothetical protein